MPIIYIDNKPYEIRDGQNLLHACLSLGFNIPYFCWHPAMHSVGACRQCAVKQFRDENDTKGKIIMSCMTPATDGTRISIDDPEAKAFRASVIEWLMTNHPHDCPVCDEGGECHLQDMTVMAGHVYRRHRFRKRTYRNQDLGPFLNHEMNRCIQCYRCVRFYADYAGGRDLNVFAAHNNVYFGRYKEGVLENEFSGNLIEVCPTGVFTDKTLKKNYTRKWDLQTAPSICPHCGLGCNTIPAERYGRLRRILTRYNGEVNGYFICDRGRFGYGFVNSKKRMTHPMVREKEAGFLQPASKAEALVRLSEILHFGERVIGIGSPRASLEANFALMALVGRENFFTFPEKDRGLVSLIIGTMKKGPARTPSLKEIESADAVFLLGEDITNVAPRLALALRQSIRQRPMEKARKLGIPLWNDAAVRTAAQGEKGPLFIGSSFGTKLDDVSSDILYGDPDELARLGFAVAQELDSGAPAVGHLSKDTHSLAKKIAHSLREAKRPLVICGMSSRSEALINAAANVAGALHRTGHAASLCFTVDECNTLGLGLMPGRNLEGAFKLAEEGKVDTAIILENDLYRRSDAPSVEGFLKKCNHVVVIDHSLTPTAAQAEVALPAGTFAESTGTFVNNEGRAQRFFKVFPPIHEIQESLNWLKEAMAAAKLPAHWQTIDDVITAMAAELPIFGPVGEIAPPAGFRLNGMKVPREPARFSGRTAITAQADVHEPKPPADEDSPLAFSMEGFDGKPPSSLISRYWSPGWNSVAATNKFQNEVGGPLRDGDPGRRLIEPEETLDVSYTGEAPEAFVSRKDEWLIVPLYHIFGSEELSAMSPEILRLSPEPYLALGPDDAHRIEVVEGKEIDLRISGIIYRLPVRIKGSIPNGIAAVPAGISGLEGIVFPIWGRIIKTVISG